MTRSTDARSNLVHECDAAKTVRLGVLHSGGGRALTDTAMEHIYAAHLPVEAAVVVASRPCPGVELAQLAGIPVHVVPRKEIPDVAEYSRRILEHLDGAGVDLVVQAGFLSLWHVPPRYEGRVMNMHSALLPSFGGSGMYGQHVHEAVLRAGCKVSGCTVHFVTNEYDRGPIILQRAVPVEEGDTPDTLAERVFEQECIAYPQAIALFAAGRLRIDGNAVRVLPPG